MIRHYPLTVGPFRRGFHLVTPEILHAVTEWPQEGLLHVFIRHTSAGLTINENADATVLKDFELFFNRLAPEEMPGVLHDMEGPDDMPAHIKSTLCGSHVTVPVIQGRPALGTWQGIYLCEFRNRASARDLIITIHS